MANIAAEDATQNIFKHDRLQLLGILPSPLAQAVFLAALNTFLSLTASLSNTWF